MSHSDDPDVLEQHLLDARPIRIHFQPDVEAATRAKYLLAVQLLYQSLGGQQLVVEDIDEEGTWVRLKPRDDPARNLIY